MPRTSFHDLNEIVNPANGAVNARMFNAAVLFGIRNHMKSTG
jgi:hypothetical protein